MFVRSHLNHGNIMHDQAYNFTFHQKLESFQCNASRVITVTVRATSRENLYQEFCLELLQAKRWYRELCWLVCCTKKYAFLKIHVIDKKATSLLISRCYINQIFHSNLFLLLFSSEYFFFRFTMSRRYSINIYVLNDWYLCYFYVLCV